MTDQTFPGLIQPGDPPRSIYTSRAHAIAEQLIPRGGDRLVRTVNVGALADAIDQLIATVWQDAYSAGFAWGLATRPARIALDLTPEAVERLAALIHRDQPAPPAETPLPWDRLLEFPEGVLAEVHRPGNPARVVRERGITFIPANVEWKVPELPEGYYWTMTLVTAKGRVGPGAGLAPGTNTVLWATDCPDITPTIHLGIRSWDDLNRYYRDGKVISQ